VRGGVRGVRVNQASPRDERVWEAIVRCLRAHDDGSSRSVTRDHVLVQDRLAYGQFTS